jgi:hypothetical protein
MIGAAAVSPLSRSGDFRPAFVIGPSPTIVGGRHHQGPVPAWASAEAVAFSYDHSALRTRSPLSRIGGESAQGSQLDEGQSVNATDPRAALSSETGRLKVEQFFDALRDALELYRVMITEDEISPLDDQTLRYAFQSLLPLFVSFKLPPPLILPLQNGGIGAEWHTFGMNIELRFRKPYDVYAVIEDARGTLPEYHGRDRDLLQARSALSELSIRAGK